MLTGVHELKGILETQKEAIGHSDIDSFLNLDDAFHRALYRLAGREFLWNLIQQSNVHYLRYRRLHMLKTEKLEESGKSINLCWSLWCIRKPERSVR